MERAIIPIKKTFRISSYFQHYSNVGQIVFEFFTSDNTVYTIQSRILLKKKKSSDFLASWNSKTFSLHSVRKVKE